MIRRWGSRNIAWRPMRIGILMRLSPLVLIDSHRCRPTFGRSMLAASTADGAVMAMRNRLRAHRFKFAKTIRAAGEPGRRAWRNDRRSPSLPMSSFEDYKVVCSTYFHAYQRDSFGYTGSPFLLFLLTRLLIFLRSSLISVSRLQGSAHLASMNGDRS